MMWKILTIIAVTFGFFIGEGTSQYFGRALGSMVTQEHKVSGRVYAVDAHRIRIVHFNYDGQGPDAYFWVGTEGEKPSTSGIQLPDETGSMKDLGSYSDADLVLTLPAGTTLYEVKWISVWCKQFNVDFGHLVFPRNFAANIPTPAQISGFSTVNHGVTSGTVDITDTRTIFISEFKYDGNAADAFFWVGKGEPDANGQAIPNEDGSTSKLTIYTGKDLTLRLPSGLSVTDIDYIAIWSVAAAENFGHVTIPSRLNIPPYIEETGKGSTTPRGITIRPTIRTTRAPPPRGPQGTLSPKIIYWICVLLKRCSF